MLSAAEHWRDFQAVETQADYNSGGERAPEAPLCPDGRELPLRLPAPEQHGNGLAAVAVLVDRFGNVALNLSAEQLELAQIGSRVEVVFGDERYLARVVPTFTSVRPSDIVVLIDSYGQVEIAVSAGSAAEVLGLVPGDKVTILPFADD